MSNEILDKTNAETTTKLHTKVGLAVHPDSLLPLGETLCDAGGHGQVAYAAGRRALGALYETEASIHDALDAMSEPTQVGLKGSVTKVEVPYARRAELAANMGTAAHRAYRAYEVNTQAVEEAVAKLAGNVESALTDPNANRASHVQTASEIRRYVANLASGDRMMFLQKAIKDGDVDIAHAVLAASCYVSGLDKNEFKLIRDHAALHLAPRDFNQLNAARQILDTLNRAGDKFITTVGKLRPKVEPSPGEAAMARLKGVA
jgi:hypothetical protein